MHLYKVLLRSADVNRRMGSLRAHFVMNGTGMKDALQVAKQGSRVPRMGRAILCIVSSNQQVQEILEARSSATGSRTARFRCFIPVPRRMFHTTLSTPTPNGISGLQSGTPRTRMRASSNFQASSPCSRRDQPRSHVQWT